MVNESTDKVEVNLLIRAIIAATSVVLMLSWTLNSSVHHVNGARSGGTLMTWRSLDIEVSNERGKQDGQEDSRSSYRINLTDSGFNALYTFTIPVASTSYLYVNGTLYARGKDDDWTDISEFAEPILMDFQGVGSDFRGLSYHEWQSVLDQASLTGVMTEKWNQHDMSGADLHVLSIEVNNEHVRTLIATLNTKISAGSRSLPLGSPERASSIDVEYVTLALFVDDLGVIHRLEYVVAINGERERRTVSIRRYAELQPLPSPR